MRDSSVIEVDAQAALERVFCRAVQAADVPGIARPGVAGAAAGCLMAHGLPGNPVAAGRMLVYLVPPAAVTSAGRLSGPRSPFVRRPVIVFLRIEVESPAGARGECLLQAAAGRETEDG